MLNLFLFYLIQNLLSDIEKTLRTLVINSNSGILTKNIFILFLKSRAGGTSAGVGNTELNWKVSSALPPDSDKCTVSTGSKHSLKYIMNVFTTLSYDSMGGLYQFQRFLA